METRENGRAAVRGTRAGNGDSARRGAVPRRRRINDLLVTWRRMRRAGENVNACAQQRLGWARWTGQVILVKSED